MTSLEQYRARKRAWYHKNKEKVLAKQKEYKTLNKDKVLACQKKAKENHKERVKAYNKEYIAKKRQNIDFRLKSNLRSRLSGVIKKRCNVKGSLVFEYLGCSSEEFRTYLESKFEEGMTWENYGLKGWEIDHILPISSALTHEEFKKLSHYTNLQPLWMKQNRSKSDSFEITLLYV